MKSIYPIFTIATLCLGCIAARRNDFSPDWDLSDDSSITDMLDNWAQEPDRNNLQTLSSESSDDQPTWNSLDSIGYALVRVPKTGALYVYPDHVFWVPKLIDEQVNVEPVAVPKPKPKPKPRFTWKYSRSNPDEWNDAFPTCKGVAQSPINIRTSQAFYNPVLKPIIFYNYNTTLLYNVTNDGRTVAATQLQDQISRIVPFIRGSDFGDEVFELFQFHFHWGNSPASGSEHLIDGKAYPAELHLVHKSRAGNFAVLGFFLEISPQDNPDLATLIDSISANALENAAFTTYLSLASILPDLREANAMGYFRYMGSLTTPPCTEGLIWTVFRKPIKISEAQMQAFYKNSVKFNYRPVQNLNNRGVFISVRV